MKTRLYPIAVGLAIAALAMPALAKVGQELHISAQGEVHLIAAEIAAKHAANLFTVEVWNQKWTVSIDRYVKLESAYGAPITVDEILATHTLEIKGKPVSGKSNVLDVRLIRDLDIKTGTPPPPTPLPAPSPAATPVSQPTVTPSATSRTESTPPPAGASATGKLVLTRFLTIGARGPEVTMLQEFLQKNGWGIPANGPVTGYYGRVTAAAVMAFQRASGIPAEGVVGPKTRALINAKIGGE